MRILFSALLFFVFLLPLQAEAKTSWVKPHTTKNGSYVRGHYTAHRSHISLAAKHKKH